MERERERDHYNGSNSKRPKERKTVLQSLCLLVKQVCQSHIHIHTHTLSQDNLFCHQVLQFPLQSYFYLIGNLLVVECTATIMMELCCA